MARLFGDIGTDILIVTPAKRDNQPTDDELKTKEQHLTCAIVLTLDLTQLCQGLQWKSIFDEPKKRKQS